MNFEQVLQKVLWRLLTVMFCDLVGSTALSTAMDPEDLRDVIALRAPILGWFTEGFDTADLKAARTLLADLEAEVCPLRP
jgi:hypothetical protein